MYPASPMSAARARNDGRRPRSSARIACQRPAAAQPARMAGPPDITPKARTASAVECGRSKAIPDVGAIATSVTWPPELSDPTFASDRRCFIVGDPNSRGECRASRPREDLGPPRRAAP